MWDGTESRLRVPVSLEAGLHVRVVGLPLLAGVEACGAVATEAVEDDGAVNKGAEEGGSEKGGFD